MGEGDWSWVDISKVFLQSHSVHHHLLSAEGGGGGGGGGGGWSSYQIQNLEKGGGGAFIKEFSYF